MKSLCKFLCLAILSANSAGQQVSVDDRKARVSSTHNCNISSYPLFAGATPEDCRKLEKEIATKILQGIVAGATLPFNWSGPEFSERFGHNLLMLAQNIMLTHEVQNPHPADVLARSFMLRYLLPSLERKFINNATFLEEVQYLININIDRGYCESTFAEDSAAVNDKASIHLNSRSALIEYTCAALCALLSDNGHNTHEGLKTAADWRAAVISRPYSNQKLLDKDNNVIESNSKTAPDKAASGAAFLECYDLFMVFESRIITFLLQHKELHQDGEIATVRYPHNLFSNAITVSTGHTLSKSLAFHILFSATSKDEETRTVSKELLITIAKNETLGFDKVIELLKLTSAPEQINDLNLSRSAIAVSYQNDLMTLTKHEVQAIQSSPYMMKFGEFPITDRSAFMNASLINATNAKQEATANIPNIHALLATLRKYTGPQAVSVNNSTDPNTYIRKATASILASTEATLQTLWADFQEAAIAQIDKQLLAFTVSTLKRLLIGKTAATKKGILATNHSIFQFLFEHADRITLSMMQGLPVHLHPLLFQVIYQTETFKVKFLSDIKLDKTDNKTMAAFYYNLMTESVYGSKKHIFTLFDYFYLTPDQRKLSREKRKEGTSLSSLLSDPMNNGNNNLGRKTFRFVITQFFNIIRDTKNLLDTPIDVQITKMMGMNLSTAYMSDAEMFQDAMTNITTQLYIDHNLEEFMKAFIADLGDNPKLEEVHAVPFINIIVLMNAVRANTEEELEKLLDPKIREVPNYKDANGNCVKSPATLAELVDWFAESTQAKSYLIPSQFLPEALAERQRNRETEIQQKNNV